MAQTKGQHLAAVALAALTEPGFESKAGYCQKFVRQVVQRLWSDKFNAYFKASAYETMLAFQDSPYAMPTGTVPQVGDLIYKGHNTSGRYGHVGIRIVGNRVAENSSSHVSDTDREARGTRTLDAFGKYELVVRLK